MNSLTQLFVGAGCLGFAPIFVKLVTLGPTSIGIYRCGIAAILLYLFAEYERRRQGLSAFLIWNSKTLGALALPGFLFAIDLFIWHRSVIFAGAGLGTILANTQVFYVALAGILFYGERLTGRFILSVLLAFFGTYLLISFRNAPAAQLADRYWEGVVYGLLTGIVYASYVLSIRRVEKLQFPLSGTFRLAVISAITALILLIASLFEGSLRNATVVEWLWLLALALIAQVGGWLLISRNLLKVPVSHAGLILITQPLVATLVGALVFQERLSLIQQCGAAIVFIALYLGVTRKPN